MLMHDFPKRFCYFDRVIAICARCASCCEPSRRVRAAIDRVSILMKVGMASTSRLDVCHIPAPVFGIDVLDHAQTGHFNRGESRPSFPRGDLRANPEQNLVSDVHRLMVARDDEQKGIALAAAGLVYVLCFLEIQKSAVVYSTRVSISVLVVHGHRLRAEPVIHWAALPKGQHQQHPL